MLADKFYLEFSEEEQEKLTYLHRCKEEELKEQKAFQETAIELKSLIDFFCKENLSKRETKIIKAKYLWI